MQLHEKTYLNKKPIERQTLFRSSRPEMFCKRDVLKNFAKFTAKHLWQCLFFNKVAKQPPEVFCKKVFLKISQNSQENTCLRSATLLKKRHRCFPMNFAKFLRTLFYRTALVAASVFILLKIFFVFDINQRSIQNPEKHLILSVLRKWLTVFIR